MKRICVFCGANPGSNPVYKRTAEEVGAYLANHKIGVVYGGGNTGLMGPLASAAIANGGEVIGVIPQALVDKELAHKGISELIIVHSMHERKQKMLELADAFIALPGGIGTLDETCEIYTTLQLSFHTKPIGLLNVEGYFNHLRSFLNQMVQQQFMRKEHYDLLLVSDGLADLMEKLSSFSPDFPAKWTERPDLL